MRQGLLAGTFALICASVPASAQHYEVSCPTGLNRTFSNYQPVPYAGYHWYSQWMARSSARPLPSRSWYNAHPERDITSTNGEAMWTSAQLLVHCWASRSLYLTVIHYDPVGFAGSVRALGSGCGKGNPPGGEDPIFVSSYDPYAQAPPGDAANLACGGGSDGGTRALVCWNEWMQFDVSYDGGQTWQPFWSGWVQVCEYEA